MISAVCWVPRATIKPTSKDDDDAHLNLTAEEEATYRRMYEEYISKADGQDAEEGQEGVDDDSEPDGTLAVTAVAGKQT